MGREDIDEIIGTLMSIEKEVQEIEGASEHHKKIASGTLSVAMESARLWHQVYSDREHSLHGMHLEKYYDEQSNRKLENYYDAEDGDYNYDHHYDFFSYWWPFGGDNDGGALFALPDFNITYAITEDVTTFFTLYAAAIAADISVIIPLSPNFLTTVSDVLAPTIAASSFVGSEADTFDD